HQLVEAFRSSLEEIGESDVLLHVVDAAHPDPDGQISAVREVLSGVDRASDIPEVVVLNKTDVADPVIVDGLLRRETNALAVSARSGAGLVALRELIGRLLPRPDIDVDVLLPYSRGDLLSRMHEHGDIRSVEHTADGTRAQALVRPDMAGDLEQVAHVSGCTR